MQGAALIKCPTCKKQGAWFDGKYGPFCSHRCKLIDLGKWLNSEHTISEPLRAEHLENLGDVAGIEPTDGAERN